MPGVIFQPLFMGGGLPITLVNNFGINNGSNVLTANATVPIGSFVVVCVCIGPEATVPSAIVESAGNSYTKAVSKAGASNRSSSIWYSTTTATITSGVTTWALTGTGTINMISAAAFKNVKTSSPVDKTNTASYSGGTLSPSAGATGVLTTSNQLIVQSSEGGQNTGFTTWSNASGFTRIGQLLNLGANFESCNTEYQIVTSTASVTATDTTNVNAFGEACIATFLGT